MTYLYFLSVIFLYEDFLNINSTVFNNSYTKIVLIFLFLIVILINVSIMCLSKLPIDI